MPIPSPNLDDRDFRSLLEEARNRIPQAAPSWTDLSPHDPGMVLLELFAFLTETMIYRLNRVPDKVYRELLRLIGVQLQPPAAARVELRFTRQRAGSSPLLIPQGTRVSPARTTSGTEPPVFLTVSPATIKAGDMDVSVQAYQCEVVEAELVGTGTGNPGLSLSVSRPPVIAPTGDPLDLLVGVEARAGELDERVPAREYSDKTYRVWREVTNFTNLGSDPYAYVADRTSGTIFFAPAARIEGADHALTDVPQALGATPGAGREIRVWYRRGGGPDGNVAANTLTTLKDPIPGVNVTNPDPATGGRAVETLSNALVRGPQQLHSLERAVTARDFELAALHSSAAAVRASAFTRADLWRFATPGTVEVLLVPYLPEDQRGAGMTVETLQAQQTEEARRQVQEALDVRRPLGTTCLVNWARYKVVSVTSRVVVRREEDSGAVHDRIMERLYQTINPLPTKLNQSGWPFGQALRASHVYDATLAEPGVRWADRVRLRVDEVPDKAVASVASDAFQPATWYAGSDGILFRSLNDGDGWEPVARLQGEVATIVRAHPDRPGILGLVSQLAGNAGGSHLRFSSDSGETWESQDYTTAFNVTGAAWVMRGDTPVFLMSTDVGLYELTPGPGASPLQVLVDPADQDLGFYGIAASVDVRGGVSVAVASQGAKGVYLSSDGGRPGTFRKIVQNIENEDVRVLAVQYDGPRAFVWAGTAALGPDDNGRGLFRWELRGSQDPPEGWVAFGTGWQGGSCRGVAFLGTKVVAATHHTGVLRLDPGSTNPAWQVPDVRCGLPLRDAGRFHPVDTVATNKEGTLLMAGGIEGVFRSSDGGMTYEAASNNEFIEKVTLPDTWLFVSGAHDIAVVGEDEAGRD
jgi:hypothetical protein